MVAVQPPRKARGMPKPSTDDDRGPAVGAPAEDGPEEVTTSPEDPPEGFEPV